MGPIARSLGHLAAALGSAAEAHEYFAEALEVARRMGARPWMGRIALEWAEFMQRANLRTPRAALLLDEADAIARELGLRHFGERIAACRTALTSDPPPRPAEQSVASAVDGLPAVDYFRLTREGEMWLCECPVSTFRMRDSRGMQMLAKLLAVPGKDIHVLDLMGVDTAEQGIDSGDSGEILDERARREYRRRLEALREEVEEAESHNDLAAAEAAREELEHLSSELSRAFGLGGRARRAGSNVERARVNVQRRLKNALERISRECPTAGRHLDWAVRTGSFCSYRPG
jgi:hypothetical protein